jgi:hypothetical protein
MTIVERWVEWKSARETEVLGVNLPQNHFAHNKSYMTWPGLEPGPPRGGGSLKVTNKLYKQCLYSENMMD